MDSVKFSFLKEQLLDAANIKLNYASPESVGIPADANAAFGTHCPALFF